MSRRSVHPTRELTASTLDRRAAQSLETSLAGRPAPTLPTEGTVMNLGAPEMLIVLAVVLLLFGARRVPDLARSLGEAQREFRHGSRKPIETDTNPAPES